MAADSSCKLPLQTVSNNCVATYRLPKEVFQKDTYDQPITVIDYNPALGLFATLKDFAVLHVWNPTTREVVAEYRERQSLLNGMSFLPGNRIGICSSYGVSILTLKPNQQFDVFRIKHKIIRTVVEPSDMALTPDKKLLVVGPVDALEIVMDWDNLNVLSSRVLWSNCEEYYAEVANICCSNEGDIFIKKDIDGPLCLMNASGQELSDLDDNTKKGESTHNTMLVKADIKSYIMDGKVKMLKGVEAIHHDGNNLIIEAPKHDIILLESATDGSKAHLITNYKRTSWPIRINHKGQLMVYTTDRYIKVYDYRIHTKPRCLQDLCREAIRDVFQSDFIGKVENLPISAIMKDYLLYQ